MIFQKYSEMLKIERCIFAAYFKKIPGSSEPGMIPLGISP